MNTEELRILLRTVADTSGAQQTQRALSGVQQEATRTGGSLGAFAARLGGSFAIADFAIQSLSDALRQLPALVSAAGQAFSDSERLARANAAAYGSAASSFQRFASALSAATGQSRNSILEAALSARTLSQNYGLTIEQTQRLIRVSADLAGIRGIGVSEAFERVQSAIRGEAEASEYLGLTLNDTFIKNNALNGSVRNTFERMTDAQKAQIRYGEVLRQTAQFSGLAASSANSLEGAQRRAASSSEALGRTVGGVLAPAMRDYAIAQAQAADALTAWFEQWQKLPTEQELRERAVALEKTLPTIGPQPVAPVRSPLIGPAQGESADQALTRSLRERRIIEQVEQARITALRERNQRERIRLREESLFGSNLTGTSPGVLAAIQQYDQIKAANDDLRRSQDELNRIQREGVQITARQAAVTLQFLPAQQALAEAERQLTIQRIAQQRAALPATQALEDLRYEQQRAQLITRNRNASIEERRSARLQLRQLGRQAPGVELAALEAGRAGIGTERDLQRLQLQQQLLQAQRAQGEAPLQAMLEQNRLLGQVAEAVAAQRDQTLRIVIESFGIRVEGDTVGRLTDEQITQLSNTVSITLVEQIHQARQSAERATSERLSLGGRGPS